MDKCPKCSGKWYPDATDTVAHCIYGSEQRGERFFQSDSCRIGELESDVARLEKERDLARSLAIIFFNDTKKVNPPGVVSGFLETHPWLEDE